MPRVRVNTIVNREETGAPTLTKGMTVPAGATLELGAGVNISGIATVGFLTATNMNVGVLTATKLVGDGSQLTGVQVMSPSKAIAIKYILDPLPFRA